MVNNVKDARPRQRLSGRRIPQDPFEWTILLGIVVLIAVLIAFGEGWLGDRLRGIAWIIGLAGLAGIAIAVRIIKGPEERWEKRREKGLTYRSWWVPRSWKVRLLVAGGLMAATALVASQSDGRDAMLAACLYLGFLAVAAWHGHSSNYVELAPDVVRVSKGAAVGPHMSAGQNDVAYTEIHAIRMKMNGDFEIRWLDEGKRDNERKTSFKIVPERRNEFLDDLKAHLDAARTAGYSLTIDRR